MKAIRLDNLTITNFRGIKYLNIDFSDSTSILGKNGSGKTSVFNAFLWLIYGKDDQDRKDYDIKYRDSSGQTIDGQEVSVKAVLTIEGRKTTIERILREKWQTVRGTSTKKFNGDERVLFWDEVPLSVTEFQSKIREVVEEKAFKLITNPMYFNSLHFKEKRDILLGIVGEIRDGDIWEAVRTDDNSEALDMLLSEISNGRTIEEHKRVIVARKNKAKEERDRIEPAIAERLREMPDDIDFDALDAEKLEIEKSIKVADENIVNKSREFDLVTNEVSTARREVSNIESELNTEKRNIRNDVIAEVESERSGLAPLEARKSSLTAEIRTLHGDIASKTATIERLIKEGASLNESYKTENAKQVDFSKVHESCSLCERPFEEGKVGEEKDKIVKAFNDLKRSKIESLTSQAVELKKRIATEKVSLETFTKSLDSKQLELDAVNKEIADLSEKLAQNKSVDERVSEELSASSKIEHIESKLLRAREVLTEAESKESKLDRSDVDKITAEKTELMRKLVDVSRQIARKDEKERALKRIEELRRLERVLSDEISIHEGDEFILDSFVKAKMTLVENKVNGIFTKVKFRMFEPQTTNDGERPLCDTLVNGVEWGTVNTGARVAAGVDIINVLRKSYGITAPIFIDGMESVTETIETDAQIIKLIVSPEHSKLTVLQ